MMEKLNKDYWLKEMEKCKQSSYYFFTNHIQIKGEKLQTFLTEEEFNNLFKEYGRG